MQRRNKRYGRDNNRDDYSDKNILFSEFRYYNRKKKIIDDAILKQLLNKALIEESIHWTDEVFAKARIGFVIKKTTLNEKTDVYIKIMELSFDFEAEQFCNCKHIIDKKMFITFELTYDQLSLLEDLAYKNFLPELEKNKLKKTLDTWSEIVDALIANDTLIFYESREQCEWKEFLLDLKILLGNDFIAEEPTYEIYSSAYSPPKCHHILKVIEKRIQDKNYRVAILACHGRYSWLYMLKSFSEDMIDYNYIDENRIYAYIKEKNYYDDISNNQYVGNKLVINLDLYKLMEANIQQVLGNNIVITPQIYRFYSERVTRYENRFGVYLTEKEKEILEQYRKLLDANRTIRIGVVQISKTKIAVDDEMFKIEFDVGFLNVVDNLATIKHIIKQNDVRYNFNVLYENLLRLSSLKIIDKCNVKENEYKMFNDTTFKANGMTIEVKKESNRIKVNDIFCRIDDVFHMLSKVICYTDVNEFNKYVKEVSYIGVNWKKMISNGITLDISNPFLSIFNKIGMKGEEHLFLRFSLLWDSDDRRKIYLLLNDNRYEIKYKGKFMLLFDMPHRKITMTQLKRNLNECIENLDDEMILDIVDNAIEEAKIIQERGEMLVRETIKEINAEETKIEIQGKEIEGYLIEGRVTNAKYFIAKADLGVFKYTNSIWNRRCVVDDHTKQRIFEDRLANRLINIYNEFAKIHTLHNI
jgi:hypothetical protein